jgi:hypothetical protein
MTKLLRDWFKLATHLSNEAQLQKANDKLWTYYEARDCYITKLK